ncbi:MAG: hypothetical protein ACI90V_006987, partial [Bacillariaceae sp.]
KSPKATIDENSQHRKFVWRRFSQQLIFFREGKFSAKLVPIYKKKIIVKIYYIYKDVYFI